MNIKARMLLVAVTGVLLVAATVFTLRSDGGDPDRVRGFLGPTPGPEQTSDAYVATKRAYLSASAQRAPTQEAAALVSLNSHVPAPGAQKLASRMDATAVWVRFPGEQERLLLVKTTIAAAVSDAAAASREEIRADIDSLTGQVEQAQGEQREQLSALLTQRKDAYAKVDAACGCVYAFAVQRTELSALNALQARDVVRLVDVPRPLTADLAGWELAPLVPA